VDKERRVAMSTKPIDSAKTSITERRIEVNGTYFHVKSVFSGDVSLEKALATIAKRKMAELKTA